MKRILALISTIAIIASLTACSEGNAPETPDDTDVIITDDTDTAEPEEKKQETADEKKNEFALNPEYLALAGKTKRELDSMFGEGEYSMEFGMTDYKNGIVAGWGTVGNNPTDDSKVTCMNISLEKLFFNCPDTVTTEQIKSLFSEYEEGTDEMDGEQYLLVNCNGHPLSLYPQGGLSRTSYAFYSADVKFMKSTNTTSGAGYGYYYDYALKHDAEFLEINKNRRDDRAYYYLADIDHDSYMELVVKIGCGVGVYDKFYSGVEEIFRDDLAQSSGSVNYIPVQFEGKDYIAYESASSSEYRVLYTIEDKQLKDFKTSMLVGDTPQINGKEVSRAEYDKYVSSIEYPQGVLIDGLR